MGICLPICIHCHEQYGRKTYIQQKESHQQINEMELSFHSIGKNNHTLRSLVIKVTQFCLLRRSHFLSDELHLVIISVKIPVGIPLLKFFPHSSPFCLNYLWHPTPVLLPGKSHGRRSLEGCSPWGCEEFTGLIVPDASTSCCIVCFITFSV